MNKHSILLAFLMLYCAVMVAQNQYYVRYDSSENCGTGMVNDPFCHVSQALDMVVAGDIIYLMASNPPHPAFSITGKSGAENQPITIRNNPGETVIVDGSDDSLSYTIRLKNSRHVRIEGLEITGARGTGRGGGIFLCEADSNSIINNHIHGNIDTLSGIKLYASSHNLIQYNHIHDNKFCGIHTTSVVYNNADDGIDAWMTHAHDIIGNISYGNGGEGDDEEDGDGNGFKLGGLGDWFTPPGHHYVAHNISYNNTQNGFHANGSGGSVFYHNVAYNNGEYGFSDPVRATGQNDIISFYNNIVTDNGTANLKIDDTAYININYNLYFGNDTVDINGNSKNIDSYLPSNEPNSLNDDPLFVNPTAVFPDSPDFHLESNSPAIDAGNPTITTDYIGEGPDMGVYEHEVVDNINNLSFNLRFFLEGAYDTNTNLMRDDLRTRGSLSQDNPWQLSLSIPDEALAVTGNDALVDWVLIYLRDANDISTILYETTGLVQSDGDLVQYDGTSPVTITDYLLPTTFYISIFHPRHLPAMTAQPVNAQSGIATFDFTTQNAYLGGGYGQKELESGVWGLYSGDSSQDRDINGQDKSDWVDENGSFNVSKPTDFNMDADVNGADKIIWENNNGVFSNIPNPQ